MDNNHLLTALDKTGFMLEYKVQRCLRAHGWNVINNKYYVDDISGAEREIDMVAYRFSEDHGYTVCTVLVISCKKSSESGWVFMTTEHDPNDQDYEANPLMVHSGQQDIHCMMMCEEPRILGELLQYEHAAAVHRMPHRIFAYQQVNERSLKPEDDKRIFDSIITTIKAANYERGLHAKKPLRANVINYHMLSVFEGSMTEVYFDGDGQQIQTTQDIKYVSKHIVSNHEAFYKVHFIRADAFDGILSSYDALANEYAVFWRKQSEAFFRDPFCEEHRERIHIPWEKFSWGLKEAIIDECYHWDSVFTNTEVSEYTYDPDRHLLTLLIDLTLFCEEEDLIADLNQDSKIREITKKFLLRYFRYDGSFIFDYFTTDQPEP